MGFLTLSKLEKTYPDGTRAVKGIDLDIREGEFVVLLGPSGCGKTTTLRMIAGLEIPTAGRIELAGEEVTRRRPSERDVGFVFQFYALYPHLTVRENVVFPLRCAGMAKGEIESRLAEVAGRMTLAGLLNRHPRQLSGGDQQRVALARAMIRRPKVYLMDEPLGTLDADRRLEMREFIRDQQLQTRVTTVYVTHDQEEAMSLADRIVVMDQGLICQEGPPAEVYDRPASLFVANFVGSPGMNFVPGEIGAGGFVPKGGGTPIPLPRVARHGPSTLGIRCEHVRADSDGPLEGRVAMDEYLGGHRNVHVDLGYGRIVMRASAGQSHAVGSPLRLAFDHNHIRLFDPPSGAAIP